jgi:hypothetical protein
MKLKGVIDEGLERYVFYTKEFYNQLPVIGLYISMPWVSESEYNFWSELI